MLAYWIPEVHSKSGIEAQISFDDILKFYKSGLQAKEMKEAMIKYITSDFGY